MWPIGLFLIENDLGKRFNKIIMNFSTTKLVFLNILHKSVSNNYDIFLCPMLGKVPSPLPLNIAPVQKGRLQKYLLFLKKRERNHRPIIAARLCFVNELELILFA